MIKTFTQQINEKKDHIINKLPLLSREQKDEVIAFFNRKPNLERKIDWNKGLKLAWKDFVDVMREVSKTERKKAVREHGIAGLKEGKDYVELKVDNPNYLAYIPLHWEASKLIASNKIGGCEGAWCIAFQKDISYWNNYVLKRQQLPIYVIGENAKWSVMVHSGDTDFDVWDHYDAQQDDDDIPGLHIMRGLIRPNAHLFDKLRKNHFSYKHFIEAAETKNAKYKLDADNFIQWESGEWVKGLWEDGHWLSGDWKNGTWNKGEWEVGTWHDGVWRDGYWKNGNWLNGTWEDGSWEVGTWWGGQWKDGTWYDGDWKDGLWVTGTFKDGTWRKGIWKGGAFISGSWWNGIWQDGMWMDGKWLNGQWRDGYWRNGEWRDGEWLDGTWGHGTWWYGTWYKGIHEDGDWKDGDWLDGHWSDGFWEKGTWHKGTWEKGSWNGGTWLGGTWGGGYWGGGHDSKGVWHEKGDSPDKW